MKKMQQWMDYWKVSGGTLSTGHRVPSRKVHHVGGLQVLGLDGLEHGARADLAGNRELHRPAADRAVDGRQLPGEAVQLRRGPGRASAEDKREGSFLKSASLSV